MYSQLQLYSASDTLSNYSMEKNTTAPRDDVGRAESGSERGSDGGSSMFQISATILFLTSILINVGILCVICKVSLKRKVKNVTLLLGNLCIVVIYGALLSIVSIFEHDKRFKGEYLCNVLPIQRVIAMNLLPLTILSISYERMRKLKPRLPKIGIFKLIITIWTIATVTALPALWTTLYNPETELCVKVAAFHRMIFQVFRCITFNFVVSGVLIWELYKVRSKFKYLYKVKVTRSKKVQKKVQRVRFIYCTSITFICYWFPVGVLQIFYEVTRKPSTQLHKEYPTASYLLSILFFVYVMCLPVILFWTSDLLKPVNHASGGVDTNNHLQNKLRNNREVRGGDGKEEIEMSVIVNSEFSRCSTHAAKSDNNLERKSVTNNVAPEKRDDSMFQLINSKQQQLQQCSSGLQQVEVEVYI